MNPRSPDRLDELAHANPVPTNRPPSGSKARVWARIQEARMETSAGRTRRVPWALGVGAVALAAVAAFAVLFDRGATPAPSQEPGPNVGSCVETYTAGTLANRDFAFDGTVIAIDGDSATFAVTEVFRGDVTDPVTLDAPGMTGAGTTTSGGLLLEEGQRYLVAGDDRFVWSCGFTQPHTELVAAEWEEATR
jgi:hypothetical protein